MAAQLASWIAIAGVGLVLSGCAAGRSAQRTITGWFGASDAASAQRPQARYAAKAGVRLHREPDASSEIVGQLGLHEGVLRYKLESGFAYVTSEKTGRSGWVRERELIERLPAAQPAATAPAQAPQEATPSAPEEPEEPAELPESTEPPEKSIFDPY